MEIKHKTTEQRRVRELELWDDARLKPFLHKAQSAIGDLILKGRDNQTHQEVCEIVHLIAANWLENA